MFVMSGITSGVFSVEARAIGTRVESVQKRRLRSRAPCGELISLADTLPVVLNRIDIDVAQSVV